MPMSLLIAAALVLAIVAIAFVAGPGRKLLERFSGTPTLYFFSMPSCPHCRSFEPVWREVDARLRGEGAQVQTRVVDGTREENRDLLKRFGVRAFPTLVLMTASGSGIVFNGPRTAATLLAFVRSNTR